MKVLIVEDEVVLADTIAERLQAEGFECDTRADGFSGLEAAADGDYDAVILDIMLPTTSGQPSMNGYKVCREFRRRGIDVPVLMISAKSGEYDEVECFETGANDFVHKPFSFPVLVARLRSMIDRPGPPSHEIEVGELVLNVRTRTCIRDSRTIQLTEREQALLKVLMLNTNRVVSKQFILDQVWGADYEGSSNVVEVYIRYLRQKIDEPFESEPVIHTVWGTGYRLAA